MQSNATNSVRFGGFSDGTLTLNIYCFSERIAAIVQTAGEPDLFTSVSLTVPHPYNFFKHYVGLVVILEYLLDVQTLGVSIQGHGRRTALVAINIPTTIGIEWHSLCWFRVYHQSARLYYAHLFRIVALRVGLST